MEIKKNAAQSPVFTLEYKRVPVPVYRTELVSTLVAPAKPETYDLLGLTADDMRMLRAILGRVGWSGPSSVFAPQGKRLRALDAVLDDAGFQYQFDPNDETAAGTITFK